MVSTVAADIRAAVHKRDGRVCQYCGTTESNSYIAEHIVPRRLGGPTALHNLTIACSSCNARKRSSVWAPRNLDNITSQHPDWRAHILATAVPIPPAPGAVSAELATERLQQGRCPRHNRELWPIEFMHYHQQSHETATEDQGGASVYQCGIGSCGIRVIGWQDRWELYSTDGTVPSSDDRSLPGVAAEAGYHGKYMGLCEKLFCGAGYDPSYPPELVEGLEQLIHHYRQHLDPNHHWGSVLRKACDELLQRDLPGYVSPYADKQG